jgi:hypothetical protein
MSAWRPATSTAASEATPDIDVYVAVVVRLDQRETVLDLIISAPVGERLAARPFQAHDVKEFVGPRVALVLVGDEIAVASELLLLGARDHIERDAAFRELVERRELAGQHRGGHKSGPVGDEDPKAFGHVCRMMADQQRVGSVGVEREQRPIEACIFMRLGDGPDVVRIDDRPAAGDNLRGIAVTEKSDELDGHVMPFRIGVDRDDDREGARPVQPPVSFRRGSERCGWNRSGEGRGGLRSSAAASGD